MISPLIKKYKNLNYEVLSNKIESTLMTLTVEVTLPRPKLKNVFLEAFNEDKHDITVESQVTVMLKYLQLKTHAGRPGIREMLEYSSQCHKNLSRNAKIFPYDIRNGVVIEKFQKMAEFMKFLKDMEVEKGIKISSVQYAAMNENQLQYSSLTFAEFRKISNSLIVYSLEVLLPNGDLHCVPLKPQLIKAPRLQKLSRV